MTKIKLAIIILFLSGCTMTATYTPPEHDGAKDKYSVTTQKDFDTVWKQLIQYSASTFFAIDNYEKDSGLITLSFGAAKPSDFITGGNWKASSQKIKFDGDYVNYVAMYQKGSLSGKMNIVVTSISDNESSIRVSARYIFSTPPYNTRYSIVPGNTWSFDTGNCSMIAVSNAASGIDNIRTICPTYKAENAIISAVR